MAVSNSSNTAKSKKRKKPRKLGTAEAEALPIGILGRAKCGNLVDETDPFNKPLRITEARVKVNTQSDQAIVEELKLAG